MKLSLNQFSNSYWFISGLLSKENTKYLNDRVEVAKKENKDFKQRLIGQITSSLEMQDPEDVIVKKIINPALNSYDSKGISISNIVNKYVLDKISNFFVEETANFWNLNNTRQLELVNSTLWVNFQSKYEYNPLHFHPGMFTFVCWLKVPYRMEDENNYYLTKTTNIKDINGCLGLVYHDGISISVDYVEPEESKFVIFPSYFQHMVNPFYSSDGERISISGNYHYIPIQNKQN